MEIFRGQGRRHNGVYLAGDAFQPAGPEVVLEPFDDAQPLPLRHQGCGSLIKGEYRMGGKEIRSLKFSFCAHIGNNIPRIKPKRQLCIEFVGWQFVSLWVVLLPVRSQYASKSFYSISPNDAFIYSGMNLYPVV